MEVERIHGEVAALRVRLTRTKDHGFRMSPVGRLVIFPECCHFETALPDEHMDTAEFFSFGIDLGKKPGSSVGECLCPNINIHGNLPQKHVPHASSDPPRVIARIRETFDNTVRLFPVRSAERAIDDVNLN